MPAVFLICGDLGDNEHGGALWACGQMDLREVWPFGHLLRGGVLSVRELGDLLPVSLERGVNFTTTTTSSTHAGVNYLYIDPTERSSDSLTPYFFRAIPGQYVWQKTLGQHAGRGRRR